MKVDSYDAAAASAESSSTRKEDSLVGAGHLNHVGEQFGRDGGATLV